MKRRIYLQSLITIILAFAAITLPSRTMANTATLDTSPGTNAPPATLGGHDMMPFPLDTRTLEYPVSYIAGSFGRLDFMPGLRHTRVGAGWPAWSHGYTGDVYVSEPGYNDVVISLPGKTHAFYFYVQPNAQALFNVTVSAEAIDGTPLMSAPAVVEVGGALLNDGTVGQARYFGFYTSGTVNLGKIKISLPPEANGFAIGEFGINIGDYVFNGFFQPVDNLPIVNKLKAGNGVPVKFNLSGYQGMQIFADGYPRVIKVACDASEALDTVEETVAVSSNTLVFEGDGNYNYKWRTDKTWVNTCRHLVLRLNDGSEKVAEFRFVK